jgi:hypothetical protein
MHPSYRQPQPTTPRRSTLRAIADHSVPGHLPQPTSGHAFARLWAESQADNNNPSGLLLHRPTTGWAPRVPRANHCYRSRVTARSVPTAAVPRSTSIRSLRGCKRQQAFPLVAAIVRSAVRQRRAGDAVDQPRGICLSAAPRVARCARPKPHPAGELDPRQAGPETRDT